ncbi:Zinc finger, RING-type [Corchorus olitorius]|uniref:Zinc finger, RING-type n=1 Tax=Corchorus olitorius TaxID=93759 RepID=A0A1R3GMB0_9ROSI|nr:Zinc finger, RING-type [Corchorus olitorius]
MVRFTDEELRRIMEKKTNIRNMTIICHVDHRNMSVIAHVDPDYKSTPGDSVVAAGHGLHSFQECDVGELMAADQGTCAICLEGFSGNSCFKMPCSHVFHGDCIGKWLSRKTSCPMCRSRLS